jgi:hypothetical protein
MFSDAKLFDPQPLCQSGNCTWQPFDSVGWCTKCANATDSLVLHENCHARGDRPNCTTGFEQGLTADIVGVLESSDHWDATFVRDIVWTVHNAVANSKLSNRTFLGYKTPFMVFVHASITYSTLVYGVSGDPVPDKVTNVQAEQCFFTPCLMNFQVTTTGGISAVQTNNITYGSLVASQYGPTTTPLGGHPAYQRVQMCWQATPSEDPYTSGNQTANATAYAICPIDVFEESLQARLTGNDSVSIRLGKGYDGSVTDGPSPVVEINSIVPDFLNMVQLTSLSEVMNNLAASLTKLSLDVSNETANGEVHVSEVFVVVTWEWLILPGAVEIFGVIFLLSTVVLSRRRGVGLWKTSILVPLYHGFEDHLRPEDVGEDLAKIDLLAQKTIVKLDTAQDNSRIVLKAK